MAKLPTGSSDFLKHTDLPEDSDTVMTIKQFLEKELPDGKTQWVVYFDETGKGLGLNATNRKSLIKACGTDEMNDMVGKRVALFVKDDIEFQGEIVSGIRVRPKKVA